MEAELERLIRAGRSGVRAVRVADLRTIAGGYSQETFSCDCEIEHEDGTTEWLELIVRRDPPPEADILPTSRTVEHRLLERVRAHTSIPVPEAHFLDDAGHTLGRPAMVMQRVPGTSDLTALFANGPDTPEAEAFATDLCRRLAELHTTPIETLDPEGALRDPRSAGIDVSSWDAYMESSLDYFLKNYRDIAFDPLPVFYDAYTSLRHRLPAPGRLAICHGDFQPSNFLCADGRVTGVIDWENAHIGDPREELGWLYHMSLLMGTDIFGAVKADGGFLGHYTKLSGIEVSMDDVRFFQIFSAASLASPILSAVSRRLAGETSAFMHVYLMQPLVASIPVYASILGYPASSEAS